MRRIVLAVMSTIAAVVVLFGYRTSTSTPVSTVTTVVAAGSGTASPDTTSTTPAAPSPTSAATTPAAGSTPTAAPATPTATAATARSATTAENATKTVTGQTEDTRWGPVQVQITVSGGKITGVNTLQLPSGNGRDAEINDAAVPILTQEALQAQSAQIDGVSGATYTSQGYVASLQSALDQAGL